MVPELARPRLRGVATLPRAHLRLPDIERGSLEPIGTAHAGALHEIANDPRVGAPAGMGHPVARVWADRFCTWRQGAWATGEAATFAVVVDEMVAGCAGLHDLDPFAAAGELSIWLSSRHAGRGLGASVVRLLVRYGFEAIGLERVVARCRSDNDRARRLFGRVGFVEVFSEPPIQHLVMFEDQL